jgi:hypothetical protein
MSTRYNPRITYFDSGVTAATSTTITGESATINGSAYRRLADNAQYRGFYLEIYKGTGAGQSREITAQTVNGWNVVEFTVGSAWSVTPDTTSRFRVVGHPYELILVGNGSNTVYRYDIATNTWATDGTANTTPVVDMGLLSFPSQRGYNCGAAQYERPINASSSLTAQAVGHLVVPTLSGNISIFRGGGGTRAWTTSAQVHPGPATGSSFCSDGNYMYMMSGNTGRPYAIDPFHKRIKNLPFKGYGEGTAVNGSKLFFKWADETRTKGWLYSLSNTSNVLKRLQINYEEGW